MANFNLCMTSCVLLVTLMWRLSSGSPIPQQPSPSLEPSCLTSLPKTLLQHISQLLKNNTYEKTLDLDEDCAVFDADEMIKSQTVQACAPITPQNSACTSQKNSFNEGECLGNIQKDLSFYHAAIKTYINATSTFATLGPMTSAPNNPNDQILRNMMETIQALKNCCQVPDEGHNSSLQERHVSSMLWNTTYTATSTYDYKVQMCKVLKAFRSRAITISRALGYISSGDHKK